MTVKELITILANSFDLNKQVVISNVLNAPFATYSIKEVVESEEGPLYLRANRKDNE